MTRQVTQVEKDEGPRSYAALFAQIADGDLEREASAKLHEIGLALDEAVELSSTAKGEITITLKFSADRKTVKAEYEIKIKKPAPPRPASTLWLTAGSNFSPANPRQGKLPLRDVTPEEREGRVV